MSDKLVTGLMLGSLSSRLLWSVVVAQNSWAPGPQISQAQTLSASLACRRCGRLRPCSFEIRNAFSALSQCHSLRMSSMCYFKLLQGTRSGTFLLLFDICMAHMAHRSLSTATGWHAVVMLKATS